MVYYIDSTDYHQDLFKPNLARNAGFDSIFFACSAYITFLGAVHTNLACGINSSSHTSQEASSRRLGNFSNSTELFHEKRFSVLQRSTSIDKTLVDHRCDSHDKEQTKKIWNLPHVCVCVRFQLHSDQAHRSLCFLRHVRARGAVRCGNDTNWQKASQLMCTIQILFGGSRTTKEWGEIPEMLCMTRY